MIRRHVLAGSLLLVVSWLAATDVVAADLTPASHWHEPVATLLDVDFGDSGFHSRWQFFHCTCGDVLIRAEQTAPDGVEKGQFLILDGKLLLVDGFAGETGDLGPLVQAPTLMLQLAYALLQRAEPKGPAVVTDRRTTTIKDGHHDVEIDTGHAVGTFAAPWKLEYTAWPGGDDRLRFELQFTFTVHTPDSQVTESTIRFTGGEDFRHDSFPLNDATPMKDWRMQWLTRDGQQARPVPGGATLGSLRAEAHAEKDAPAAAAKDHSG